ncbi:hypothetical protein C483_03245 [Natrialba hulunbeirensis JCM 10989]|uniref:Uncharacterized protein n=1 Tax=Natrialba hulunbeirensis JCM 10989 TaxID=1227493 RepID=M0A8C9_9EURY|nr:hypothetical protein C483_03245 [Natrialba hulunbeirensis JCM 10989]
MDNEQRLYRSQPRDGRQRHARHARSSIARSQRLDPSVPLDRRGRDDRSATGRRTSRDTGDDHNESEDDEDTKTAERSGSRSEDDPDAVRRADNTDRMVTVPEQQLIQLQNTLVAVAHAANISIGAPCAHCERSYLMAADGLLFCPHCNYRRSL